MGTRVDQATGLEKGRAGPQEVSKLSLLIPKRKFSSFDPSACFDWGLTAALGLLPWSRARANFVSTGHNKVISKHGIGMPRARAGPGVEKSTSSKCFLMKIFVKIREAVPFFRHIINNMRKTHLRTLVDYFLSMLGRFCYFASA